MKKLLLSIFLFCVAVGFTGQSNAFFVVPNGGFEAGDLSAWLVLGERGHVSVLDDEVAYGGTSYSSVEGNYFASLTANTRIRSTRVSWEAGDSLEFSWAFLAMDRLVHNDFARVLIKERDGTLVFQDILSTVKTVGSYGDTGWQEYSYTFTKAGTGFIFFDSVNRYDQNNDSILLIDSVRDSAAAVPEPATVLLFSAGVVGLAGLRKKFKKR